MRTLCVEPIVGKLGCCKSETFSHCAVLHNLWPKDQLCKHQWWIWWSIDFRMHPFLLTKSIRLSESSAKGTTCFEHPFLPLVQTRSMHSHMLSFFCCNHKNASVLETSTWQKHRWGHAEQSSQLKTNFISHLLHPNLNIWSFKLRVCNQKQSTGKRDYLHNPCHNLTPWTFWVTKHHLIDKLNPKERQIVTKMHEMGDVMGQPNKFFQQNVSTTNK